MKLYTKEDFLKAAEFCEVSMIDARYIISRIDEVTTPIELPSDEEIKKDMDYDALDPYDVTFYSGISYILNKIQGGNNEQQ